MEPTKLHDLADLIRKGWRFRYTANGVRDEDRLFSFDFDLIDQNVTRAKTLQSKIEDERENGLLGMFRDHSSRAEGYNPNKFLTFDRVEALEKLEHPDTYAVLDHFIYLEDQIETVTGHFTDDLLLRGLFIDNERGLMVDAAHVEFALYSATESYGVYPQHFTDEHEKAAWSTVARLARDRAIDRYIDVTAFFKDQWSFDQMIPLLQYTRTKGQVDREDIVNLLVQPRVGGSLPPDEQRVWSTFLSLDEESRLALAGTFSEIVRDSDMLIKLLDPEKASFIPELQKTTGAVLPKSVQPHASLVFVEIMLQDNPKARWMQMERAVVNNMEFWKNFKTLPEDTQRAVLRSIVGIESFNERILADVTEVHRIAEAQDIDGEQEKRLQAQLLKLVDPHQTKDAQTLDFSALSAIIGFDRAYRISKPLSPTRFEELRKTGNEKSIFSYIYHVADIYNSTQKFDPATAITLVNALSDPMYRGITGIALVEHLLDRNGGNPEAARQFISQIPDSSLQAKLQTICDARTTWVAVGQSRYDEIMAFYGQHSNEALQRILRSVKLHPSQNDTFEGRMHQSGITWERESVEKGMKVALNLNYDTLLMFFKDGRFKTAWEQKKGDFSLRDRSERVMGIRAKGTPEDPPAHLKALQNRGTGVVYIEAQILGGVTPQDVESVNVALPGQYASEMPKIKAQIAQLKEQFPGIAFNLF